MKITKWYESKEVLIHLIFLAINLALVVGLIIVIIILYFKGAQ
jgi:hypothetical protein